MSASTTLDSDAQASEGHSNKKPSGRGGFKRHSKSKSRIIELPDTHVNTVSSSLYYKDPEAVDKLERLADGRNLAAILKNSDETVKVSLTPPVNEPAGQPTPSPSSGGVFGIFRRKKAVESSQ